LCWGSLWNVAVCWSGKNPNQTGWRQKKLELFSYKNTIMSCMNGKNNVGWGFSAGIMMKMKYIQYRKEKNQQNFSEKPEKAG
jgi:hypothetical protein